MTTADIETHLFFVVSGGYSEWQEWGDCADRGGCTQGGVIKRIRECNRPAASFGGDPCDPNVITSQENLFSKLRFKDSVSQVIVRV